MIIAASVIKRIKFTFHAVFLSVILLPFSHAQILDGEADPRFRAPPFFNAIAPINVDMAYVDAQNKFYISGNFDRIDDSLHTGFARFNEDGTLDESFAPQIAGGQVHAMQTLANGKILIGGDFTSVSGRPIPYLARLNSNGTVDSSFTLSANGLVRSIIVRANGSILLGGKFSQIGGVNVNYIAQLTSALVLDTSFKTDLFALDTFPQSWSGVHSLKEQVAAPIENSTIYVGGRMRYTGEGPPDQLVRLTNTGNLDAAFSKDFTIPIGTVSAIDIDGSNNIVFVGSFNLHQDGALLDYNMGKASSTGALDENFIQSTIFDRIRSFHDVVVLGNGLIALSGNFGAIFLNSDGSVSTTTMPTIDNDVFAMALQAPSVGETNEKLVLVGRFNRVGSVFAADIARVDSQGAEQASPNVDLYVAQADLLAITGDSRGNVYVGGNFFEVGSIARQNLVRLLPDGSVDNDWVVDVNGTVKSIFTTTSNEILLAGSFALVGGESKVGLAKINGEGVVDPSFPLNPIHINQMYKIMGLANGKILAAGRFYPDGIEGDAKYLVRFNADGSYDASFDPGFSNYVFDFDVALNGNVFAVGAFSQVAGHNIPGVAKLSSSGVVDTTFTAAIEDQTGIDYPYLVRVFTDNRVVIGGSFWKVNSEDRRHLAILNSDGSLNTEFIPNLWRVLAVGPTGLELPLMETLVILPSGKLVIAGNLQTPDQTYRFLQRVNSDGSIDDTFFDGQIDNIVTAAQVDNDGNLLLAGNFSKLGDVASGQVARAAIGLDLTPSCFVIPAKNKKVIQVCL